MRRILIWDKHTIYRAGLRELVTLRFPDTEVVEASNHVEAFARLRHGGFFNLVLMDIDLLDDQLRCDLRSACGPTPPAHFAVLSAHDSQEAILASLKAGLHGFISKNQSEDEIIEAIRDILSGRIYVPWVLAEGMEPAHPGNGGALPMIVTDGDLVKLTPRQREVLSLLARGASNKEIARELNIAEATTKIHTAALLRALGVRNRTEAAFKAATIIDSISPVPAFGFDRPLCRNGQDATGHEQPGGGTREPERPTMGSPAERLFRQDNDSAETEGSQPAAS